MAYPVTAGSIMEVNIVGQYAGQTTMTLMHYIASSTPAITDGKAMIIALLTKLQTTGNVFPKYQACLPFSWTCTNITGQWITPGRYVKYADPTPNGANGTAGDDALPSAASACIIRRSSTFTGKSARGVTHMPAVPVNFCDGYLSSLIPTGLTAYNSLGDQMVTVVTLSSYPVLTPVVFHRANPSLSIATDDADAETTIRTMKRRVVRRGI